MSPSELRKTTFVGVVEDNNDPKKLGRCKCRVLNVFDDIASEDLPWASPWKDLNGNQFILPEKGKVVSVVFESGNIYKPEYICAEHYNINLEKKLASLSGNGYASMRALLFDHKTQIYSNDDEGLKMDYKFNNINITSDSISLNLKDNTGQLNLGCEIAQEQVVLGNKFFDWFDRFLAHLFEDGFLDTSGALLVPTPELFADLVEYQNSRKLSKYLSKHVKVVDNDYVNTQERIAEGQTGDSWKSTMSGNTLVGNEGVNFSPQVGTTLANSTNSATIPSGSSYTNIALPPDPGPISKSTNPEALQILETMRSKNYAIYTKPYQMNIIGIRRDYEGMNYSNLFKDDMFLIYKTDESENWIVKKYKVSTMPGYFLALEVSVKTPTGRANRLMTANYQLRGDDYFIGNTKNGKPIDVKLTSIMQGRGGMGILKPSQMIDVYQIGFFPGSTRAMISIGPQPFYRDKTGGPVIKYTGEGEYNAGMYIHEGYPGGHIVSNWSEGCQVFSDSKSLADFFDTCEKHREKHGNKFSYTLMEERTLKPLNEIL